MVSSSLSTSLPSHLGLKLISEALNVRNFKRARQLFDNIPQPDSTTSSTLISSLTTHGLPNEAFSIYTSLRARGIIPNIPVFMAVAKACAASRDALKVKELHNDATRCGVMFNVFLCNALIHAYGKCKCVKGARRVFDDLVVTDVVTWNSLITCYVNCGFPKQVLNVCREMGWNGVKPDRITVGSIMGVCSNLQDLKSGKEIHGFAVRHGMVENLSVCNALVNLYAKCLCVSKAQAVFDLMPHQEVVSWTSLSSCYVYCGFPQKGLNVFREMGWNGVKPDPVTVSSILPACSDLKDLKSGKEIHGFAVRHGMVENLFVCNALVNLYAKCLCVREAQAIFDLMPHQEVVSSNGVLTTYFTNRDVVSWTSLSSCYVDCGFPQKGLNVFREMVWNGVKPDLVTLCNVLPACSDLKDLKSGKAIHGFAVRHGMVESVFVCSALMSLYRKCLCVREAQAVFNLMPRREVETWTLLSSCYVNCGFPQKGLNVFREMGWHGVKPNLMTVSSILPACSDLKDLKSGKEIHGFAVRHGMVENLFVCSALVNLYGKCLRVREAQAVFNLMHHREAVSSNGNVVTWNSLSSCYVNCGFPQKGLNVIREMGWNGVKPNSVTLSSILPACSELKDLKLGKTIHGFAMRHAMVDDLSVCNALVNLYAKCLCVSEAQAVFDLIPHQEVVSLNGVLTTYFTNRNVVSWTSLSSCYVECGFPQKGLNVFREMVWNGLKPDPVTVSSILPACSNLQDLKSGKEIHGFAVRHGMVENLSICNALVNLYAKCLCVSEAQAVFDLIPHQEVVSSNGVLTTYYTNRDVVSWTSLSSCYVNCGFPQKGLNVFREMGWNGVKPDPVTVSSILPACSDLKDLKSGKEIHGFAVRHGMVENLFVCNALVNLYAKCLCVSEAQAVFDLIPHQEVVSSNGVLTTYYTNRDVVSWTSLSACYVGCGFPRKGLNVFREMGWNGVKPDPVAVSSILPACSNLQDLKSGKEIHGFAVRHGMVENLFVCKALVNLYAKCLRVREAQAIFDLIPY